MKTLEQLQTTADAKWRGFYAAATACGVWLIAFLLASEFGNKHPSALSGVVLMVAMLAVLVTTIFMIGALLEASTASRKVAANAGPAESTPTEEKG